MDIVNFLNNIYIITDEVQIFIISALPIIELRGAIPIGHLLDLNPLKVLVISILGSTLPVPFLLIFLNPIFKKIRNYSFFRRKIDKVTHRTLSKIKNIKKFSLISLLIFVAVPIPSTGVWSGSLAASLLNLNKKKAFLAIFIGNTIAGVLVTILTISTFSFFN